MICAALVQAIACPAAQAGCSESRSMPCCSPGSGRCKIPTKMSFGRISRCTGGCGSGIFLYPVTNLGYPENSAANDQTFRPEMAGWLSKWFVGEYGPYTAGWRGLDGHHNAAEALGLRRQIDRIDGPPGRVLFMTYRPAACTATT